MMYSNNQILQQYAVVLKELGKLTNMFAAENISYPLEILKAFLYMHQNDAHARRLIENKGKEWEEFPLPENLNKL